MNKITTLSVTLCVVLSSCISKYYDAPEKTYVGRVTAYEVSNSIVETITPMDIAIKANLWFSAESQKEKYEIEDKFFDSYKLRMIGDTLRISDLCDIITFNSSLELNKEWKIIMKSDSDNKVWCRKVADSTWNVSPIISRWGNENRFLLNVELKAGNYMVSGEGLKASNIYFNALEYVIKQPLLIPFNEYLFINNHKMYYAGPYEYNYERYIDGGILSITAIKSSLEGLLSEKKEHIDAEYSKESVKITYREDSHYYFKGGYIDEFLLNRKE